MAAEQVATQEKPEEAKTATLSNQTTITKVSFQRYLGCECEVNWELAGGRVTKVLPAEFEFTVKNPTYPFTIVAYLPGRGNFWWRTYPDWALEYSTEGGTFTDTVLLPADWGYGGEPTEVKFYVLEAPWTGEVKELVPPLPQPQVEVDVYNVLLWLGLGVATVVAAKVTKLEWLKYVSLAPFGMAGYDTYRLLKAKGVL